jgi:nitrate/TMAO reductase-like tetraheme cytochrome c subunit
MLKKCTACHQKKEITEFYKDTRSADGLRYECKVCGHKLGQQWRKNNPEKVRQWLDDNKESISYRNANNHLRREYGISLEEKRRMLEIQGGVCAICGSNKPGQCMGKREWAVDHDHRTKINRGILCHDCNLALGLIRDNPAIAELMAAYLRGYSEPF